MELSFVCSGHYLKSAPCSAIIVGLSWVLVESKTIHHLLPKTLPIWPVLLIIFPLLTISLIVNRKNKLLNKKIKSLSENDNKKPSCSVPISEDKDKILQFIANNKTSTKNEIYLALKTDPIETYEILNFLYKYDFIDKPHESHNSSFWFITSHGLWYSLTFGLLRERD